MTLSEHLNAAWPTMNAYNIVPTVDNVKQWATEASVLESQNAELLEALGSLLYLAEIKDPTKKERIWSKAEQMYRKPKENDDEEHIQVRR